MSAPRPYDVSEPFLMAVADPEIDYFDPIQAFARQRLAALAKTTIHRLQRQSATGLFEGTGKPLTTLWDEICWHHSYHYGDDDSVDDAFEETLDEFIMMAVEDLPHTEAVLLSCAVAEEQEGMPARSDDEITETVRDVIREAASRRSMARFEDQGDEWGW